VNNNELISVMSLGKSRFKKDYFELYRYCNKLNTVVVGGFSKLLSYIKRKYNINNIITYADRRISFIKDNVYIKNNFILKNKTNPNYFYYKKDGDKIVIYSRYKFQKHKLKNLLNDINYNKSEIFNVLSNNYRIVYDCGNLVYEYNDGENKC